MSQFASLFHTFRFAGIMGAVLMFLITGFIIGNTVKLALYARRDELIIMKLLGATPRFVSAPFILEGAIEGLVAVPAAILSLYCVYALLEDSVNRSETLLRLVPQLHFLSLFSIAMLSAAGVLVTVFSSYFAARRFLQEQQEL